MGAPDNFVVYEDYACFCPEGEVTLPQGIGMITHCLTYCAEKQINKLLVNISKLVYRMPDDTETFELVEDWTHASAGRVIVALIVSAQRVDPKRFGVLVARNRGFTANVFVSEVAALAWLRNPTNDDPVTPQ